VSNESLLRTGLIITIFIALLMYHTMSLFRPDDPDIFAIYTIAKISTISTFIFFAVMTQMIARWVSGNSFIGGEYKGRSSEFQFDPSPSVVESFHDESFTIKQTLFETTLEGDSVREGDSDVYSTWFGRRYHVRGKDHYFGIMITTPRGPEYAVLKMTIKQDGNVSGFYFSGEPDSTKRCRLTARKASRK